ncbi:MAG TPA: sensor histidine kinase [Actinomycetes bacterium]|nr:sensor histidine kinase [Actinomycetes bacterium]
MLTRWVLRPLLELGYLVAGLFTGVVTFTLVVTSLALSVGLMPVFLLGIPVLTATIWLVHGLAAMERGRAAALLDVELPGRPLRAVPEGGWVRRTFVRARSVEFWKEAGYCLLLLPLGTVSFALVVSFWSAAAAGILLPLYVDRLPGDEAVSWLDWSSTAEVWAGVAAGVVMLLLARLLSAAFTLAQVRLAHALLSPSEADALRLQVTRLTETRARVVDAADAERRRIERDLHDGAQQQLVALAMNLGRARAKFEDDPQGARELVDQAHQDAKDSITELRNVIRGVHPAVLTDRGLDAALSSVAARSPVPVRLDVDVPQRPSPTAEAVAYFVVSEALTNVARHARARHVDVHVEREGDRLLLSVADDGVGGAAERPGSGLAGLRDRVQAVDGTFHLTSPPGGGTTMTVEVPCGS